MSVKIETVKLSEIHKLANNPRHIKKDDFDRLKQSLKNFPEMLEAREIVVDENGTILGGNQRYEALKANGITETTVKRVEGWSEEKKREFVIRDNVANGEWDMDVLANEWSDEPLGEWLGGELPTSWGETPEDDNDGYYGDERERTFKSMNLEQVLDMELVGEYGMPLIRAESFTPEKIIPFNYVLSDSERTAGVHFFIDDYQFERVWNDPEKYAEILRQYPCVFTPDFSLYLEMPKAMQIWNVYRSRFVGNYLQNRGIKVIPTLQWSFQDSYEFCFDGIEPGGTVAISTIGVKRNDSALQLWREGLAEAEKRLKPTQILCYGGAIDDYNYSCEVVNFENNNFKKG